MNFDYAVGNHALTVLSFGGAVGITALTVTETLEDAVASVKTNATETEVD